MNKFSKIEARLDRSLERQIRAPRLDGKFDAAVWSRIEAQQSPVSSLSLPEARRALPAARWLFVSNLIGGVIAASLLVMFGMQFLGGAAAVVDVPVSLPALSDWTLASLSEQTKTQLLSGAGYVITLAVLGFAVSLTSFGRRLRANLSL